MLDAKHPAKFPPGQSSPKDADTTFQRILQLTEQICRRFETRWHAARQDEPPVRKSQSKWPTPLQGR